MADVTVKTGQLQEQQLMRDQKEGGRGVVEWTPKLNPQ